MRGELSWKEFTEFTTNFNKDFTKFVHLTASFGGLPQRRDHRRLCMALGEIQPPIRDFSEFPETR
jgi:hypothetical protein